MRLSLDEALTESQNYEEVDVPEAILLCPVSRGLAVKRLHVEHELFLLKEMKHLPAVKLNGVDEEDGVVMARYESIVQHLRRSGAVPAEVVGEAVEEEAICWEG